MNAVQRIGTSAPRRDDAALLAGQGRFFATRSKADALQTLFVRSPRPHARIVQIDLAGALATDDVVLALTAQDLWRNGPLPAADLTDRSAPAHQTVLADGVVRYAGEPVVALFGPDLARLRHAAKRVRIDYADLPPLASIEAAMAPGAAALRDTPSNAVHELRHHVGDPQAAFGAADHILEGTFRFHRVAAMPLEPRGVEAWMDAENGRLMIAATTQIPGAARDALAALLDLSPDDVVYEPLPLGGGFGCKEAFYSEEVAVAEAALRLGRRVRWQETRSEHFRSTVHGRQGEANVRMALDRDGIVTALSVMGRSDIGAGYSFASNSPGAALGAMIRGPYRIPNFEAETVSVTTNKTPLNVYRGAGHPQAVFAMERMMDRAAAATGIDRAEIRRRNLIARVSFPLDRGVAYPGAGRIIYDSGHYEACLAKALDAIGYADFPARRAAFEAAQPHRRLGIGLGMLVELTSTGPDETVEIAVDAAGFCTIATAAVEMGQRSGNALVQILSDRLQLPPAQIAVAHCRPLSRSGGGSYASRGAAVIGAAVADGAARIADRAIRLTAAAFNVSAEMLRWIEGGVTGLPGRNAPLELAELLRISGLDGFTVTGSFVVPASTFASACHAAVVAVDIETGEVSVEDYAVAHDCGRLLNPSGVEDQIIGGVMQGIGATLFEEIVYDDRAMPMTSGLFDYPLPVAACAPRFHLRHVETPSPINPLGFKGAGEGGFVGVPAAIVGAIEHALREFAVTLSDDGPYTPSRVLGLLRTAPPSTLKRETVT